MQVRQKRVIAYPFNVDLFLILEHAEYTSHVTNTLRVLGETESTDKLGNEEGETQRVKQEREKDRERRSEKR